MLRSKRMMPPMWYSESMKRLSASSSVPCMPIMRSCPTFSASLIFCTMAVAFSSGERPFCVWLAAESFEAASSERARQPARSRLVQKMVRQRSRGTREVLRFTRFFIMDSLLEQHARILEHRFACLAGGAEADLVAGSFELFGLLCEVCSFFRTEDAFRFVGLEEGE